MRFPATSASAVLHERIGSPFASTVHEPQNPRPQPNFVPVMARSSRKTQSSGVSGEEETACSFPLIVSFMETSGWRAFYAAFGVRRLAAALRSCDKSGGKPPHSEG